MEYEKLLEESTQQNLIVREMKLLGHKGRIYNNRVAIRHNMTSTEKGCVLAEELGHHYTTVGNILDQSSADNRKQEYHARLWAYNKLIGLRGIISAHQSGCRNISDVADYLDVTEEFLQEALSCYRQKYGLYAKLDNYVIYFEPNICVFEMNSDIFLSYVKKQ